jgi:hypothetical protein
VIGHDGWNQQIGEPSSCGGKRHQEVEQKGHAITGFHIETPKFPQTGNITFENYRQLKVPGTEYSDIPMLYMN